MSLEIARERGQEVRGLCVDLQSAGPGFSPSPLAGFFTVTVIPSLNPRSSL